MSMSLKKKRIENNLHENINDQEGWAHITVKKKKDGAADNNEQQCFPLCDWFYELLHFPLWTSTANVLEQSLRAAGTFYMTYAQAM